jgi:hypothetical protein
MRQQAFIGIAEFATEALISLQTFTLQGFYA